MTNIKENEKILKDAERITLFGIDEKDALHIACAIEGKANFFLTTDIRITKKSDQITQIKVCNPIQFFLIHETEG